MQPAEGYEEIRSGIRALCTAFPDEYFRQRDAERGYPDEWSSIGRSAAIRAFSFRLRRLSSKSKRRI
jgi:hypothetical protein